MDIDVTSMYELQCGSLVDVLEVIGLVLGTHHVVNMKHRGVQIKKNHNNLQC